MFMDALSAATNKKDIRKRKRLLSTSTKDEGPTAAVAGAKVPNGKKSPPPPDAPLTPTSPKVPAAPMKFYQDTLETSENDASKTDADDSVVSEDAREGGSGADDTTATTGKDDKVEDEKKTDADGVVGEGDEELKIDIKIDDPDKLESMKMDIDEVIEEKKKPGPGCGPDGPPGVLCIHRKKGPKKQLKWKPNETLVEIEYFLLDETERVNVTKTFVDARSMERSDERHAMQNRKLPSEDLMEERTAWMPLIIIDNVPSTPEGRESREKKIQIERESRVLQSLYFNRSLVPDSAAEPDMEMHPKTDPIIIPLEDVTANPDAVNDFTNMIWPEAKGSAPPPISNNNYQNINNSSNNNNNMFPPEHGGPIGFVTYDNQANWMGGPPPNGMLPPPHGIPDPNQMNYNPMMMNMMPPNPHMPPFQQMAGPGPQNFPPNNFQPNMMAMPNMNMNPNMPPMNMNHGPPMRGGPNGPMNNDQDGRGGWFRGNQTGGGGGGPGNNNNNWNNRDGRRDDRGGRDWPRNNRDRNDRGDRSDRDRRERGVCRQFQNSGFCRLGEKCNFLHVGGDGGGGNRGHNRGRY
jgi:protein phosphatase 1 regulatory subunit 10